MYWEGPSGKLWPVGVLAPNESHYFLEKSKNKTADLIRAVARSIIES